MKIFLTTLALGGALLAPALTREARADFGASSGNLVLLRLGTGAVDDTAQPVFLDEYDPLSGSFVASHAIASTGAGAMTIDGAGGHEGLLRVSTNGQYLLFGGYRAQAGAANPSHASASSVNRVVGRVDGGWNADTSTALSDAYSGGAINAVVSDTGERFWTAGDGTAYSPGSPGADGDGNIPSTSGGLRYVSALGASTTLNISQTQATGGARQPDSLRAARIVDGQLYINSASQGSFVNRGLFATTDALPTSGPQTMIPVMVNIENGSGPSGKGQELAADSKGKFVPKSDLVFADLNPLIAGDDTAYSTGGKNEYEKWSLIGGVWKQVGIWTITSGPDLNALQLRVDQDSHVTLFAAAAQFVLRFTDSDGYIATQPTAAAGSHVIADYTAFEFITPQVDGSEFRGMAMLPDVTPVPEPTTLGLMAFGALALFRRRRRCA